MSAKFAAGLLLWMALIGNQGFCQPTKESDRRAACLYKLADFVDWPAESFRNPESPVVIGVLGADPFGRTLDDLVRNEVVQHRKLVVERFASVGAIQTCHVLFISPSEEGRLAELLPALRGKTILTVGESENFLRRGGMVRFVTEKSKLRLRINVPAARAANLTLSSKLLRIAELAGPGGGGR